MTPPNSERRAAHIAEEVAELERDAWLAFYSERGIATIPLRPRSKRPLRAGWLKPSADVWVGAPPDANVGVLCGAASGGLVVLDFDTRDGLHEACGMRAEALAVHTLVARTARGWHVYARAADVRTRSPWDGLDIRAEGSMVVAPPSVHPSGALYAFLDADAPVADLSRLPFELAEVHEQPAAVSDIDWEAVEALVAAQAPKLIAHWAYLTRPAGEFDRSRADFAVARCLWQAGYTVEQVAAVLVQLPGSKAHERGETYARRTAMRAAQRQGGGLRGGESPPLD